MKRVIVLVILVVLVQTQVTKTSKGMKEVSEATCNAPNTVEPIGTDCDIIYGVTKIETGKICCREKTVKKAS